MHPIVFSENSTSQQQQQTTQNKTIKTCSKPGHHKHHSHSHYHHHHHHNCPNPHHHHHHHRVKVKSTRTGHHAANCKYHSGSVRHNKTAAAHVHTKPKHSKNASKLNSIKLKTKNCPNLVNVSYLNHNNHTDERRSNPFRLFTNSTENMNNIDKDIIDLNSSSNSDDMVMLRSSLRSLSGSESESGSSYSMSSFCLQSSSAAVDCTDRSVGVVSSNRTIKLERNRTRLVKKETNHSNRTAPDDSSDECSLFSIETNSNQVGLLPVRSKQIPIHPKPGGGSRLPANLRTYIKLSRLRKEQLVEKGSKKN